MCLFRSRQPTPLPTPQPIQPRNPDLVQAARLPSKKELLDPDDVAGVEYGTTQRKDDTRGAAKRTGTDALKININTGGDAGGGTGGLNV
jgi:hypothetical protein|tara:strand:- start:391 stop:657 length:267 start_codon:yes stop_codon:yes gene_type:complete